MGRILLLLLVVTSCSSKKKNVGLAPAQNWAADPSGGMPAAIDPQASPHGAPQGELPSGHPPIDDQGGELPSGHPPIGSGMDVTKMGFTSPDPNRAIDPTHHVKGVIRIHPKAKDRVKAGTAVFVVVKKSVDGAASGPPLAVDKLTWGDKDEIPFEMTEAQAMIAGTQLTGDVIVSAHYDQDSDAISKQPGDVLGEAHVKVPADNVVVTLDQVVP